MLILLYAMLLFVTAMLMFLHAMLIFFSVRFVGSRAWISPFLGLERFPGLVIYLGGLRLDLLIPRR